MSRKEPGNSLRKAPWLPKESHYLLPVALEHSHSVAKAGSQLAHLTSHVSRLLPIVYIMCLSPLSPLPIDSFFVLLFI